MKNLFKSLIFVTFMAMSGLASAVCYTNANQIPVGSLPLHPSSNGGALCTTKSEANGQWGGGQGVTLVTTQQQIVFQPVPAGQVFNNCTPQQEIHRAGLMALFGAAIGGIGNLLIKDNGRDAGKGAGAGLIGAKAGSIPMAPVLLVFKSSKPFSHEVTKVKKSARRQMFTIFFMFQKF